MLVDVSSGINVAILVKSTGNGTGDILNVNLRCASSGYFSFRNHNVLE